jgi:hypothetical protein
MFIKTKYALKKEHLPYPFTTYPCTDVQTFADEKKEDMSMEKQTVDKE